MRVTLSSFGGIVPRRSPHTLASFQASIAHDVRLRNGRLEAWRERCPYADVAKTAMSFHLHGCCVTAWDELVQVAEVSPDWDRAYITGRTSSPEVMVYGCDCGVKYYKLGVPQPKNPPRASATGSCSRKSDARSYVYTYVNAWGEESAPSPPSNVVTVADGTSVRITNISTPPAGYNITGINLYRATTGFREPDVKQQKPLTDYLYVTTLSPLQTSYTDTMLMKSLGPALETQKVRMPPAGLRNIVAIEGVVRLAGTTKNRVHMTENFQLHNWPAKYDLTLDSNIVHMGALDQKLYVTTDTTPYVIDVSSCEDMKCTPVTDLGIPLPDVACQYSRAALITQHGFIYSTPLGLVLIDPTARYHILTKLWFSPEDWVKVAPETVRLGYYEGFLFCITDRVSFILNIDSDPYGDMKGAELVTISDKPVDLIRSSAGALYMLEDGKVSVWDKGLEYRPFTWVSRELTGQGDDAGGTLPDMSPPLGVFWSPASAKIRTRDTEFTLITPLQDEAYKRKVTSERPFRLPRVGRHPWYKVRLHGIRPVEFFTMGTANFTVNAGI